MKLEHSLWTGLLVCAVLAAGCGKPAAPADGVYRLTYRVPFAADHAQAKAAAGWAETIGKRTGGRVRIQVDATGQQAAAASCYQHVEDGGGDIGMCALADTRGRFPLLEGVELPVGFANGAGASRTANELAAKFGPTASKGVKLLFVCARGPAVLVSKLPVAGLRELKGLRVLAAGADAKVIERLGGSPVAIPADGGREALLTGAAGAAFCPAAALKERGLAEAVNSMTDAKCVGCASAFVVVMNKPKWKALPADLQQDVEAVSAEWAVKHGQAWDAADAEGLARLAQLKRDMLPLTAAEQAAWSLRVAPLLQAFAAHAAKKGLPGEAFLEALKAAAAAARAPQPKK